MTAETLSQKNANHHWYPFLKYQEECKAVGKEATVNDWMRSTGRLNEKIEFEKAKEAAAMQEAAGNSAKKESAKESTKD